jgi:2-oxoisovalerate dehydrogenase E2 component (dihydrolipoyl transacylase)
MGLYVIKLNDVGEGIAEAELVEWHVSVGDEVAEDQLLGVVMTDKAAIEIPSSVAGTVVSLSVEAGEYVAVGSELVRLEVDGQGNINGSHKQNDEVAPPATSQVRVPARPPGDAVVPMDSAAASRSPSLEYSSAVVKPLPSATTLGEKPRAAPSVRRRLMEAGIELRSIEGSGPAGRIIHEDVDHYIEHAQGTAGDRQRNANTSVKEYKIIGVRRKIAEQMSLSYSRIPHITIVEEVDVTILEELRTELNDAHAATRSRLTVLPFVMKAIVEAVREQPAVNARYDEDAGVVFHYGGVHIGIATQTENGLLVPVVKHCETLSLWDNAREISRLAKASRSNQLGKEESGGSTITISSLGAMGGIATTPIINHPEVAIVGINKMVMRPQWDGQQFMPRKMMNLSCSFDHRIIDGWDAAVFIQKLRTLLEQPAMLFLED